MYVSKSCIYAIRAALFLTIENTGNYIAIRQVSEELDIPFHYLTKILQILGHQNIIVSTKGPGGGIRLKKSAGEISLYDIIYAVDGDSAFNQCTLGLAECSEENPCILHDLCYGTKQTLLTNVKKKSLSDIAGSISRHNFSLQKNKIPL